MTDKQIEKALDCCCSDKCLCYDCPHNEYNQVDNNYPYSCERYLMMDALALIRRQKAQLVEQMLTVDAECDKCIAEVRAEAIREFAERIKSQSYESVEWSHGGHPMVCEIEIVEEIAEEMTEEQK